MPTLVQEILRVGKNGTSPIKRKHPLGSDGIVRVDLLDDYPHNRCIHELFESQVETSPDSVAVSDKDSQLTYRELNARANQLARFLKRFGIGPNSLVSFCVERSPEMIVGILGILKAGAAYVPMDPSSPPGRLVFIMQDAEVFMVVTQSSLLETIPRHHGPKLSLDTDWDVIAKERRTNPARRATPRNLAYVIHTPGSSSQAKSVRISHRGLLNYLSWGAEAYEIIKGSGMTVDSKIPFDLAITRVLSLLMLGRTIFLDADTETLH